MLKSLFMKMSAPDGQGERPLCHKLLTQSDSGRAVAKCLCG